MIDTNKIKELNPWFYNLKIGNIEVVPGIGSPHTAIELVERTEYMKKIFVDEVRKHYNFEGKSILDVGSNCAYWSSWYAKMGAKKLIAIEGRQKFVDQGLFYWEQNNFLPMNNVRFICGDVTSNDVWNQIPINEKFDFCLCCGILYHITKHDFVLEKICSYRPECIFVDTRVSFDGEKHANNFEEVGDYKFDAIPTNRTAKHPTLKYLYDFFENNGYQVVLLPSPSDLPKDNTMQGKDNFVLGKRVALLCSRK